MERRKDLYQRANHFFNHKISVCPRCGSRKEIEEMDGNEVILEHCSWCGSKWKVIVTVQELRGESINGGE
jgi:uncharacterized Zn finger protein